LPRIKTRTNFEDVKNADCPKYPYIIVYNPAFVRTMHDCADSKPEHPIDFGVAHMAFDYNGRRDPLAYAYRRRWGPHSRGGFRGSSSTEGTACLYRRGLRGTRFLETGTTTSGRNSWQQGASIRANRGFGSCGDSIGIQVNQFSSFVPETGAAWSRLD
jgi:hypothetical protein